jgi:hypothetical protein
MRVRRDTDDWVRLVALPGLPPGSEPGWRAAPLHRGLFDGD